MPEPARRVRPVRAGLLAFHLALFAFGCTTKGPGKEVGLSVAAVTTVDSSTVRIERRQGWRDADTLKRALVAFRVSDLADLRRVLNLNRESPSNHDYVADTFPDGLSDLPPAERKRLFLDTLRPIVAFHNGVERYRRARLRRTPSDRAFTRTMAASYGVDDYPKRLGGYRDTLNVLSFRVGPVPRAIVLGQAALESGWGTSSLAVDRNNLFGQKRSGGGYASFGTISQGVESYLRNVNTHGAYSDFRNRRRRSLTAGATPTANDLIPHLTSYSTRGTAYLKDLRRIIAQNALERQ